MYPNIHFLHHGGHKTASLFRDSCRNASLHSGGGAAEPIATPAQPAIGGTGGGSWCYAHRSESPEGDTHSSRRAVLHGCKAILAALDQASKNAQAAALGHTGKLAIGFTMCAAFSVVPGYARRFATAYPEVVLNLREVVSNDLAAEVLAGQIDAAIMFPGLPNKSLAMRRVVTELLCVALSRSHPRAGAARLRIAQLAEESFVMALEEVAPTLRATILAHCRLGGFEPKIRFEVQLQQTVLGLVDEGAGIALVPASMRKAQLAGVVFRRLVDAPQIEQVLVWSTANRNPCLAHFLSLTEDDSLVETAGVRSSP
jgi:DNA-binding transcriptional LysR family regulator